MSGRRLHTRPTTALISAGGCGQSRARSALVTMIAAALSVSTQQSRRCSGLTIQRLLSTSSTVTRFLYSAFGLQDACSLCATLTIAACSGRVPCSYMWRMKVGANHCAGLVQP